MSEQNDKNDWPKYYEESKRIDEHFAFFMQTSSAGAYEYGVLALKNFTLISGGGLLAIPAIASMAPGLASKTAALSGLYFSVSLICCLLATYTTHWNWSLNYRLTQKLSEFDKNQARDAFLPTFRDESNWRNDIDRSVKINRWWINVTFYLPHLLALVGFTAFARACFVLYSGLDLIGENS